MDKRKNVLENLLKVRGHAGFPMFSHLQHRIFVAETKKKIQTDVNFLFVSAAKSFSKKKVAKQRNLTWGHAETYCNIFRFLLPSHKNCFRDPLALEKDNYP